MKNDIELFTEFYSNVKQGLENVINNFNSELLIDKKGYLKDNLELFCDLNKEGKLIRGFLVALGYKLAKEENIEYSYPLAHAYELFQTSVLIHDDVIDEDNLRRGKDTIHYGFYKNNKDYNDSLATKIGDSVATCVGDYGFFEANKELIKYYKNDPNFAKVLDYYNDVVLKTIEGELIDVVLSFDGRYKYKDVNLSENIMTIYRLKTAFYTIIGPLNLGLILGGIDGDKLKDIEQFGEKVGISFQIQDDILGIYNDMGKVIGSDIREFKQTILYSYTVENSDYKDELLKYYGKEDITDYDIEMVREIFKKSGAYDYAYNMMNNYYNESLMILDSIEWINQDSKNIIKGFIEFLRRRNK